MKNYDWRESESVSRWQVVVRQQVERESESECISWKVQVRAHEFEEGKFELANCISRRWASMMKHSNRNWGGKATGCRRIAKSSVLCRRR